MDRPLAPLKPKTRIPSLFLHPQNPHQIPFQHTKPTTLLAHKAPPPLPTTTNSNDHQHNGKLQEAILALEKESIIRPKAYMSLLQSCIDSDSIDEGRRLHASLASVRDRTPFVETKLVSMYAKCGSLEDARRVFDEMRERNLFSWSAMINGCAREQRWEEVVAFFYQMMLDGVIPDGFLLPKFLQACANTGDVETARLLHSLAVRCGLIDLSHVGNSILAMYAKCGELSTAVKFFEKMITKDRVTWNSIISAHCQCGRKEKGLLLFERMRTKGIEPGLVTWNILISSYNQSGHPEHAMELMKQMAASGTVPDVFTWTSMISGFAQNNRTSEALDLFQEMQLTGVEPNGMTLASTISVCASLKTLDKGRELHCYAIKIGTTSNILVGNSLINMYAKCGRLEDAQRVFDLMLEKDVFTWNSMIGGYAQVGYCGTAYDLFSRMEDLGVRRNVVTWNVMISGYVHNGDEDQAMELFERMERCGIRRNTASWNTLIAGCLQNGHANKALRIFLLMQSASERPNSVTILSVLSACANLVSAWKVKEIHACILHIGLHSDVSIANALIDAYSKSGKIESAQKIFNALPSRDLISWNSMIAGCVFHGLPKVADDLFYEMKQEGVKPNKATFVSIIHAYSLLGLVNEGKKLFSSMTEEYQLSPGFEHYSGMVHLLGRAGRFREASDLIEKMPIEPDSSVWTALLVAGRAYGNIKLVDFAAEQLIKVEPKYPEIHRLLSCLHVLSGKTSSGSKVRKLKASKVGDYYGCCWIEIKNKVYTFLRGGKPIENSDSNYAELNKMADDIKVTMPDIPDTELDFEEPKEEIAGIHSEKLAVAFALANSPSRYKSIHLIKSVRMCTDCHTTMKIVSKVYQREILLKDPKGLHHFKDGKCSCRDYW